MGIGHPKRLDHSGFQQVFKNGKVAHGKFSTLRVLNGNSNDDNSKFGISVSKKVGIAVRRNKVKRMFREIMRNDKNPAKMQVFSAHKNAAEAKFQQLFDEYHTLKSSLSC